MSKPRPPKVNLEALELEKSLSKELIQLRQRFRFLQTELRDQQIQKTYIALEALAAFCGGRVSGYFDDDLRQTWPSEWGEQTIAVPFALLKELADSWADYQNAPAGRTFGEVLGIEGGGQGKSRTRNKRVTTDNHYRLAREVWLEYLAASLTDTPISQNKAKEKVAEKFKISFDSVDKAFKSRRRQIKHEFVLNGLLPEG